MERQEKIVSRLGFIGRERDFESDYFALGARQYDAETGRFLSVDPLFESFDAHTSYHYAYNSPIKYKDPSGLAPEKEEETQSTLIDGENVGLMFLIGMQLIAELDDLAERFAKEDAMYEAEADALFEQRNAIIGGNKDGGGGRDSKDEAKNGNPKADDDKEGNRQKKIKEPDTGSEDKGKKKGNKGDIEIDYNPTLFGFFFHFKFGDGEDYHVALSSFNLEMISASDFNGVGDTKSINLFSRDPSSLAGLIIGEAKFTLIEKDKVVIKGKDTYDFDIRWSEGLTKRNIGTAIGGIIHKSPIILPIPIPPTLQIPLTAGGEKFDIYFHGKGKISP